MNLRNPGKKVVRLYFSGESGKYFHIDSKIKTKIEKEIIDCIKKINPLPDRYIFEFRATDGFSALALNTVMSYINTNNIVCSFWFRSVMEGDFESLPNDIQTLYNNTIFELSGKGVPVRNDLKGAPVFKYYDSTDITALKINYHATTDSGPNRFLISYFEPQTKDKWIKKEYEWHTSSRTTKLNLCKPITTDYIHTDYTGIRKQKNSSKFYYRIKMKLPDGTPISIEKGSFLSAEEASKARREKIISLTTQNCTNMDLTVDEVFEEFISKVCKDKSALKKKYASYYNAQIKERFGELKIGETQEELNRFYNILINHKVIDKRTENTPIKLSKEYIAGMRAMLCNLFDYAYNMKYISSHPMYALPSKWYKENSDSKKEKNEFIQPLFAYSGNKHKLLPYIHKLFPKKIDTFVDLFGGSAVVGINIKVNKTIVNDGDLFLIGIYNGIQVTEPQKAWGLIESMINKYSLNNDNESGYYICRDDYNKIPYEERCTNYWYWGLVLVWSSFNRSTVQFNQQKEYNAPFGFNKVNFDLAKRKFFAFADKVYANDKITFVCDDYSSLCIPENAFVYLDPPYLITTASYNKGWNEDEEERLYDYLEKLDDAGIKWAMSNVLKNNGKENIKLSELIKQRKYRVHYLDNAYEHANFRRKNKGKTVEVLITNY